MALNDAGMQIYAIYGLGSALIGALLALVGFLTGLHGEHIQYANALGWLTLVVSGIALVLGQRASRDEAAGLGLSYGRAVGVGVLISLWQGAAGAAFTLLYATVINPGFGDALLAYQLSQMEEKNVPPEAQQMVEKLMHVLLNPAMQTVVAFFGAVLWGLIIALIAAAFLKRAPAPMVPPEAPPPLG